MFVTEYCVGLSAMTSEATRDEMMARRNTNPGNAVDQLQLIAGLCNSGEFDASTASLPLHERKIHGDATDQAVLRLSESLGSVQDLKALWKNTFELAFNSKNKFMIRTLSLVKRTGLQYLPNSEAERFQQNDLYGYHLFCTLRNFLLTEIQAFVD